MRVMEFQFPRVDSRTDSFSLYPLGDVHIGALNCAESAFRRVIKMIKEDQNAYWIGGGDYLDAVILQDQKRFDPSTLPGWLLAGHVNDIRATIEDGGSPEELAEKIMSMISKNSRQKLSDMVKAQRDRFLSITAPIHNKCIGLIEGNHEYSIMKYHNRSVMDELAESIGAPNLTDCAFLRFRFTRNCGEKDAVSNVRAFICHGHGGGRTPGAEPNHLARLAADKECELVLRGHSHTQHILPPIARMTLPTGGPLGDEAESTICRAANWGTFVKTYASGPSTYASRATYPVRPLSTVRVDITPFRSVGNRTRPKVIIAELEMY
jgi:hypothetical protein